MVEAKILLQKVTLIPRRKAGDLVLLPIHTAVKHTGNILNFSL